MRVLFLVLSFLLGYSGSALGDEVIIPADKAVIQFDTRLGVVTFNHQMHSGLSFVECTSCHHTLKPGEEVKTCHECHNDMSKDAPKSKKAFHVRCTGCHEYTAAKGEQAGPLPKKCKLCHVK